MFIVGESSAMFLIVIS